MERVVGIEPTPSAWKAEVLPLNYTRNPLALRASTPARHLLDSYLTTEGLTSERRPAPLVEGEGFEPSKA
jgi:hypothetical protein